MPGGVAVCIHPGARRRQHHPPQRTHDAGVVPGSNPGPATSILFCAFLAFHFLVSLLLPACLALVRWTCYYEGQMGQRGRRISGDLSFKVVSYAIIARLLSCRRRRHLRFPSIAELSPSAVFTIATEGRPA